MRSILRLTPVALLMLPFAGVSARADEAAAAAVATALPPSVVEVANGGAWTKGEERGYYRAIVVSSPEGERDVAYLFLQWITYKGSAAGGAVVAAAPIKEINALKLSNAFLTIDAEKEEEAIVTVSSFDPEKETDILYTVTATAPGAYTVAQGSAEQ